MPKYRLTVVATPNGQFLVNYYHKRQDTRVDGVRAIIDFMSGLDISVLNAKPGYQNLNSSDQEIIEGARQAIIRKKLTLERKVDSST